MKLATGIKILVKVNDLKDGSNAIVTKVCDDCGKHVKNQKYQIVTRSRKDGKDYCNKCKKVERRIKYEDSLEYYAIQNNRKNLLFEFSNKNIKNAKDISWGSSKKYYWNCSKCTSEYEKSVKERTSRGGGCPYCAGQKTNHTNCLATVNPELTQEWHPTMNGDLTPNNILPNSHKKAWWLCSKCNHEWETVVKNRHLNKSGCPQCNDSKGEKTTKEFLRSKNVFFVPQYWFKGLIGIGGNRLKYDIAILMGKKVKLLIEYDGAFHFRKHYDEQDFKTIKIHDQRKNTYCVENSIPLVRIPYWEDENLEYILEQVLGYFKLTDKQDVDVLVVNRHLVNHPDWSHGEYLNEYKKQNK